MKWQTPFRWFVLGGLFLIPLAPLIVSSSLLFPYITGKAFFFRIVMEVVLAAWVVLALVDPAVRPRRSSLLWIFVAWMGWITLASVAGANPYHSFWSNYERMEGLLGELHLLAFFVVLAGMIKSERQWQVLWKLSLAVSVIVGVSALGQLFRATGTVPRLDATFGNPIYLAVYMLIQLFISLWFAVKPNLKPVWRLGYGLLAVFQFVILYYTGTRGALVGLGTGVLVATVLIALGAKQYPRARRVSAGALVVLILLGGGFWVARSSQFVQSSPVLSRLANISLSNGTTRDRLLVWGISWQGIKERPLLGWGPENFNLVFGKYFNPALYGAEPWFDRSHNILLDWLVTAGILGLVGYLLLFGTALWYLWRCEAWSFVVKSLFTGMLVAYLVQNIFVFDNLGSSLLFMMVLAFIQFHYQHTLAESSRGKQEMLSRNGVEPAVVLPLGVLVLGALIPAIYFFNVRPMLASAALVRALQAPTASDRLAGFKTAYGYGTFGVSEVDDQFVPVALGLLSDPQLAEADKQATWQLITDQLTALTTREANDARAWSLAANFYGQAGRLPEALNAYERAHALAPEKQAIMLPLASVKFELGQKAEAEKLARAALTLSPDNAEARRLLGLFLIVQNKFTEANMVLAGVDLDDRFINAYGAVGRFDLLLPLWQKKVNANPSDPQNHVKLATVYLKLGNRTQAISELQTAKSLAPDAASQLDYYISEIKAGRDPSQKN